MSLRALVIGYGSIGARHTRILDGMGLAVSVVSRRGEAGGRPVFSSLPQALSAARFDYVVIATETSEHAQALAILAQAGFDGIVLAEKPLLAAPAPMPPHGFRNAGVGYNLRFHPAAQALRAALAGASAEIANFQIGQWLEDWRPGRPAASIYSASAATGGGVLRDLSHELDMIAWLFGPWKQVAAIGGRLSNVTVDADDGWGILMSCERCPVVTLNMNCLDRRGRRQITVQSKSRTFHADLVEHSLTCDTEVRKFSVERDHTYAAMHKAMLEASPDVCSIPQGLDTVKLIAAIEKAARDKQWISNQP